LGVLKKNDFKYTFISALLQLLLVGAKQMLFFQLIENQ